MTTVGDIFEFLNNTYPVELKEDYDNVGILAGDARKQVDKALIALDITSTVAEEAAKKSAQLIISHHPVIFNPVKSIRLDGKTTALYRLINHAISAICMHTNMDTAAGGVNDALAEILGLQNVKILETTGSGHFKKITVFVPKGYEDAVREAMAQAGAGRLGNYDSCAFAAEGLGCFKPNGQAKPFIGQAGRLEKTEEVRLEAVCAPRDVQKIVAAMKRAHPYEMPAYDIFDDEAVSEYYGIGRLGNVQVPSDLDTFARFVKQKLSCGGVKVVNTGKPVSIVGVCGGADDGRLIDACKAAGTDTLVIGEMKHHAKIEALESGLNIIEAGHFKTENIICQRLLQNLSAAFPSVSFEIAAANTDPAYVI